MIARFAQSSTLGNLDHFSHFSHFILFEFEFEILFPLYTTFEKLALYIASSISKIWEKIWSVSNPFK